MSQKLRWPQLFKLSIFFVFIFAFCFILFSMICTSCLHSSLDPFVSILPTTSSSVLPLLLSVPGLTSSLHIGLYLPTSGKEAEFTLALTALDMVLQDIAESHPSTPLYIRGDWVQEPPTPSWTCSCTAASPPSPSPW